ncbi:cold-shock protein [Pedobacter ginsengiterrae]|uniref:Cold-shock protein n=2 Tax=Pedobacter TaxID=84567 RepID=A0ABV8NPA7_9SPHI|nr:cold-shock protein [Pedobacter aquatilis]
MAQGKVKFFNKEKGFGFITIDNGSEVFVHVTGLVDEIAENDTVEFEISQGKKGPTATNVRLA